MSQAPGEPLMPVSVSHATNTKRGFSPSGASASTEVASFGDLRVTDAVTLQWPNVAFFGRFWQFSQRLPVVTFSSEKDT